MRILLSVLTYSLLALHTVQAQFVSANVEVAGLTCSLCSNSVEKSIRQLDFVQDIEVNLNDNISEVTFKPGKKVDIGALAQKVQDAGFSVMNMSALFKADQASAKSTDRFTYANDQYVLLDSTQKELRGQVQMKFVGDKFLSRTAYKAWEKRLPEVGSGDFAHTYFIVL